MSLPSKAKIFEHWKDWLDKHGFDWGEPSCWACNKFCGEKYVFKNSGTSQNELVNNWNRVKPLQKCHIVPKQFDGSDDVDNLFLMCRDCHEKSPDTRSREKFLHWVTNQCFYTNLSKTISTELETFNLENRIEEINNLLIHGLPKQVYKNCGLHLSTINGQILKVSTFIAAIATYLDSDEDY